MPAVIRRAITTDAEALSSLNIDVQSIHWAAVPARFKPPGQNTFPPPAAAALLAKPNNLVFVAEVNSQPIGYVYAEVIHRPETSFSYAENLIYLHHISVRPSYRKQGIGLALMNAIRTVASEMRITVFALDVWTFNEEARSFFRRQGFTPYNERLWSRS